MALCDEVEEVEEEQGVPGEQAGAHSGVRSEETQTCHLYQQGISTCLMSMVYNIAQPNLGNNLVFIENLRDIPNSQ